MLFYLVACIDLISAILGLLFSIGAVTIGKNAERENALYMFARSAAVVCAAVLTLLFKSNILLMVVTSVMLIIQAIDCAVGFYIKNRMRTIGPFIMALMHAGCMVLMIMRMY